MGSLRVTFNDPIGPRVAVHEGAPLNANSHPAQLALSLNPVGIRFLAGPSVETYTRPQ